MDEVGGGGMRDGGCRCGIAIFEAREVVLVVPAHCHVVYCKY
jgi:hypothetical protein